MQHPSPFVVPPAIAAKVDEIMSASRARFGHGIFRMEDPPAGDPPPATDPPAEDPPPETDPPGSDALGDAGKRALDAMKADRKAAREAAAAEKARADALQAKEAEHQAELAKADQRILSAEVRAAAAGKLTDPQDALKFIDLSEFEVGPDGEVDGDAIAAAIDDLTKTKPYLAVQDGKRFKGDGDGGSRKETKQSIDQQIAEATKAGNHAAAIALKRQKAYADTN